MGAIERHCAIGPTSSTYPRCQKINLLKRVRRPNADPPKTWCESCKMSLYSPQLNLSPHHWAASIGAVWGGAGE